MEVLIVASCHLVTRFATFERQIVATDLPTALFATFERQNVANNHHSACFATFEALNVAMYALPTPPADKKVAFAHGRLFKNVAGDAEQWD